MTLWCVARSPPIFGDHLPDNDPWTLALLTSADVLALHRASANNRQLSRQGDQVVWAADGARGARYAALFNLGETPAQMTIAPADFGLTGRYRARDLWAKQDLGRLSGVLSRSVPPHGAALLRLTPAQSVARACHAPCGRVTTSTSIRQANATECRPARVSGSRS